MVYDNCQAGLKYKPLTIVAKPPIVIKILFIHKASIELEELAKPQTILATVFEMPKQLKIELDKKFVSFKFLMCYGKILHFTIKKSENV